MLKPRQSDVLVLFLFLVVLPVFVYIVLGKWCETSKRKERISLAVEQTAVESFLPEAMTTTHVIPLVPPLTPVLRECARCHGPASTRCSRCKSVRYCSGKCQIIHWRQGHKDDCCPTDNMNSSLKSASIEEAGITSELDPQFIDSAAEQLVQERAPSNVNAAPINPELDVPFASTSSLSTSTVMNRSCSDPERKISEKPVLLKSIREASDSNDRATAISSDENLRSIANHSKEAYGRHKLRGGGPIISEGDFSEKHVINVAVISDEYANWKGTFQQNHGIKNQNSGSLCSTKKYMNPVETGSDCAPFMNGPNDGGTCREQPLQRKMVSRNGSIRSKVTSKSSKSMSKATRAQVSSVKSRKGHGFDESVANFVSAHGSNGAASNGLMKVMGLKQSSKISRLDTSEVGSVSCKEVKVLFPYEEFTNFFEQEVFALAPRGLLNCGNSCYANAVLQCLTCTKPLVMYLLSRTHSRACCLKNWCLMCELEQHVMLLKETRGPLSPSRILSHLRRTNGQIGHGSQEDAHEFLRFLVASMQSIFLEEAGGEKLVHPCLQETTFVQQTFGGRLRSMVKCMRCHHESERHENIMDLTLEIFGRVESLEDALTQFTTPEDLDGENMYRCGRCASYVHAKKQLSIDEAPNILTIVLKRFQEGSYGKINKCISFPEMLDMIPFMTGTNDAPPLYMLYGVVVHVDTQNASFSGHYVSYVKDLRGNWFRIDDSVVQPVPMNQVMSEGAYILFYKRSYPRPPRGYVRKVTRKRATNPSAHTVSRAHNFSEMGQTLHRANSRLTPAMETYAELKDMEFSDATSSDWSLFTSSDEASFTSESTRDSFSTSDYSDTCNIDSFCSKFSACGSRECPIQRTISCRMFSGSKPVTKYVSEQTGYILGSYNSINCLDDIPTVAITKQVSAPSNETFLSDGGYQNIVNYGSCYSDDFLQTFDNWQL